MYHWKDFSSGSFWKTLLFPDSNLNEASQAWHYWTTWRCVGVFICQMEFAIWYKKTQGMYANMMTENIDILFMGEKENIVLSTFQ